MPNSFNYKKKSLFIRKFYNFYIYIYKIIHKKRKEKKRARHFDIQARNHPTIPPTSIRLPPGKKRREGRKREAARDFLLGYQRKLSNRYRPQNLWMAGPKITLCDSCAGWDASGTRVARVERKKKKRLKDGRRGCCISERRYNEQD